MRNVIFRLSRQWVIWVAVILSVLFVLVYSYRYMQESYDADRWSYPIEYYKTEADIDGQIDSLKGIQSEFGNSDYDKDQRESIDASISILEYLKTNHYAYSDISECICSEFSMDRLSYVGLTLDACFLFQGLAAILIIGQIVNAGLTTGASVSDYLIHGRKKVYIRETYSACIVLFVFCLFQILLTIVFSLFVPENTPYMLAYTNDGIRVMTRWTAIVLESVSLPVQLLVVWSGLYLISRLVDNIIGFSVFGGIYFVCIYFFPSFGNDIDEVLFCAPSNASVKLFIIGLIIKVVISVILMQISYICTMRKKSIRLNLG